MGDVLNRRYEAAANATDGQVFKDRYGVGIAAVNAADAAVDYEAAESKLWACNPRCGLTAQPQTECANHALRVRAIVDAALGRGDD